MQLLMSNNFSESEIDLLKEMINVGGGNVATSISEIFGKRVHMNVPFINQFTYEQVFQTVMPAEKFVKAVQIQVVGDLEGQFLFILDESGISRLDQAYKEILKKDKKLANSAVTELANILVNQFLNAIIQLFDLSAQSLVPILAEDMFGSLLSSAYLEEFQYDDLVWIFKNEFWIEEQKWESALYFVPHSGNLEKLITEINF